MKRPSGQAIAVIVLLVAVALPALYVASIGPAWSLLMNDRISFEAFDLAYAPLLKTTETSPKINGWLVDYMVWCSDVPPPGPLPPPIPSDPSQVP